MPKAILEFDLSNHEDERKHARMLKADALFGAVGHVLQELRDRIKYGDPGPENLALRNVLDLFRDALQDESIDLEDLWN